MSSKGVKELEEPLLAERVNGKGRRERKKRREEKRGEERRREEREEKRRKEKRREDRRREEKRTKEKRREEKKGERRKIGLHVLTLLFIFQKKNETLRKSMKKLKMTLQQGDNQVSSPTFPPSFSFFLSSFPLLSYYSLSKKNPSFSFSSPDLLFFSFLFHSSPSLFSRVSSTKSKRHTEKSTNFKVRETFHSKSLSL